MPTTTDILAAPMPTRPLGSTGHHASIYTLGGVKWESHIPEADAIALIHRAIELGVNTFDTAAMYGRGESERRLGLALKDHPARKKLWINTKTSKRDYDSAKQELETSLARLHTDHIDLYFMHALDNDDDYARLTAPNSVLKLVDEFKRAGHIRNLGVSGHHYKHNMLRAVRELPLDAILCPVGLFNQAYNYSYFDEVIPAARAKNLAVLGMKIFGAGRVKHAASIEPYLRYSLNQPIDTAVIGCDSIAQLEAAVAVVKSQPPALSLADQQALTPEIMQITQQWDRGEFNWVAHYLKQK